MSKVLVYTEVQNNELKKGTKELLSALLGKGMEVNGVLLGNGGDAVKEELQQYGMKKLFHAPNIENYNPMQFTDLLEDAVKNSGAKLILAPSNAVGRDALPRLAARMDGAYTSDCTELSIEGDTVKVRRPMYAGKCTAGIDLPADQLKIVLMRPNQLPVTTGTESSSLELAELTSASAPDTLTLKEVVKGESEKLDLTEADRIVSGGRGLKEAKNFDMLNDLADVVNATVGASRAVVDSGWVPHSMQVGQTGKTVAPTLYIAVAISGAIQHLAGMSGSKVIVAINSDENAPIFEKATYGLVGDAFEIVPKLTEEFKKTL